MNRSRQIWSKGSLSINAVYPREVLESLLRKPLINNNDSTASGLTWYMKLSPCILPSLVQKNLKMLSAVVAPFLKPKDTKLIALCTPCYSWRKTVSPFNLEMLEATSSVMDKGWSWKLWLQNLWSYLILSFKFPDTRRKKVPWRHHSSHKMLLII